MGNKAKKLERAAKERLITEQKTLSQQQERQSVYKTPIYNWVVEWVRYNQLVGEVLRATKGRQLMQKIQSMSITDFEVFYAQLESMTRQGMNVAAKLGLDGVSNESK